ncbi:MAG: deoxyribose-phosphate aldolase [Bacilli bacterium]|nr:deoxyribose-phosphate aldolase [Bacilli bacterium]MBN2877108.1 deoxyribose-phosphate aldolase [Bacilli bacterium]
MEQNKLIDHTYLKAIGTKTEMDQLIKEAKKFHFKSVCVNPSQVKYCSDALGESDVLVSTMIGYPLGANTQETKVFETLNAVSNGADEIEMVINIGKFKEGDYAYIENEINEVHKAAMGHSVKAVIEIGMLTDDEIKKAAEIVAKTEAEFIHISTEFDPSGSTAKVIRAIKKNLGGKEIKVVCTECTKEDLDAMIKAGATRIGTSSAVKIMLGEEGNGY